VTSAWNDTFSLLVVVSSAHFTVSFFFFWLLSLLLLLLSFFSLICALPLSVLAKLVAEFKAFVVRGMTSVNQRLANIEASMKKCTAKGSGTHAQVLVEVFGPSNVLNDLPALTREAFEEWDAKLVEDR